MKASSTVVASRAEDLSAITARLDEGARLVTVLGPEGIGKTAIAEEIARRRPSIVISVDGAATRAAVADRICVACGAPASDVAADDVMRASSVLAERGDVLVVLDGATKVLAAFVPSILERAPEVSLVVTSRERMEVPSEIVHEVGPLDPSGTHAVSILVESARRAAPGFAPRPEDVPHLLAIAAALEGVPLALELAGGRLPLVGCAALARETPSPLEHAAQRSFDALDPQAKEALAQLSVFRGGFTVAIAAHIFGESLEQMASKVDHLRARSLVRMRDPSAARFDLYAPVRAVVTHALPRVIEAARQRHAGWFVAEAEAAAARAHHDASARAWLATERENVMAVIERATVGRPSARDAEPALRAIVALSSVLLERGPLAVIAALVSPLVERTRDSGADPRLSARAAALRAAVRRERGEVRLALQDLIGAQAMARATGDELLSADILVELGKTVLAAGEIASAREHFEQAARAYAGLGAREPEARATALLGTSAGILGDVSAARTLLERACALAAGDRFVLPALLALFGRACAEAGDHGGAVRATDEAIAIARAERDVRAHGDALVLRGLIEHVEGALDAAGEALASARDLYASSGLAVDAAVARGCLGVLARERGRSADAYALLADARDACLAGHRPAHAAMFGVHLAGLDADVGRDEAGAAALDRIASEIDAHYESATPWPPPAKLVLEAERAHGAEQVSGLHLRILRRCHAARRAGREPLPPEDALVVGPLGAWFRPPHGARVGLERRRSLALVLHLLADAGGTSLDAATLFASAWPGERAIPTAAAHRVRVAVATLRKMGMRDLIVTMPAGYALSPEARLFRSS